MTRIPMMLPVPDEIPQPFPFGPAPEPEVFERVEDGERKPILFVVGVDLGQARDFSAIVIDEVNFAERRILQRTKFQIGESVVRTETVAHHRLRHVERIALGTSYPDVLARVAEVMERAPLMPRTPALVMDATGCGRPVMDLARKQGLQPFGVTITAGSGETVAGQDGRVAKRVLASTVAVALDTGRLTVPAIGPCVELLRNELRNFRVKVNSSQNESFESWREADHDDLVLAAALAVWAGERVRKRWMVNPNWHYMADGWGR